MTIAFEISDRLNYTDNFPNLLVQRVKEACQRYLGVGIDKLERSGTKLNLKTVRRIAQQCGDKLLQFSTIQLQQWRAGTLPAGDELAGKRVTVQIDGGRTKLREVLKTSTPADDTVNEDGLVISDAPGRSKPTARRTFSAEWREPKLMTIFIHNDQGRMLNNSEATIDGTFTGPDAMAELVAMHLHRLGAAQAQSITFVSDGAVWIWDRIDRIMSQAGISTSVSIHQVLDNCHATDHVSLALASLGVSVEARMPLYCDLRTQLRNGQWKDVVGELQQFADDDPHNSELQTELAYLNRHGAAGRLNYATFKKDGATRWQWGHRKHHSPCDQPASEGQWYFLERGEHRFDAAASISGDQQSLGRSCR